MSEASSSPQSDSSSSVNAVGPTGRSLRADDLPPANTTRWVIRRKAEVVAGVRAGLITLEEACRRYALSVEEFLSWETLLDEHGLSGLRATRRPGMRSRA